MSVANLTLLQHTLALGTARGNVAVGDDEIRLSLDHRVEAVCRGRSKRGKVENGTAQRVEVTGLLRT